MKLGNLTSIFTKKKIALVVLATAALAASTSGGSSAATGTGTPIDFACLTSKADATLYLGAEVSAAEATSQIDYGDPARACKNFVIDVRVPSNSSAAGFLPVFSLKAFSPDWFPYPWYTVCSANKESTTVYVRQPGQSGFTFLGSETREGTYDPIDGCDLGPVSGHPWPAGLTPPLLGTTTYRVVTRAFESVQGTSWSFAYTGVVTRTVRAAHLPTIHLG